MIGPGAVAPPFALASIDDGRSVSDPWQEGPTLLAFYKTTCPVCQMAAPKVAALARLGCRVVAIGEDPRPALSEFRERWAQDVATVTEPPPYEVSEAYGVEAVPTLFLVGTDGVVMDSVGGWDRERWNSLAVSAGGSPVSSDDDGLPPYRPG